MEDSAKAKEKENLKISTVHVTFREGVAVDWDHEGELLGRLFQPSEVTSWELETLGLEKYAGLLGVCEKR